MAGHWRNVTGAILILAGLAAPGAAGAAETLPAPTGDVVLRVDGAIGVRNGDAASFDMAMLEALPRTEIVTATPWTEGETTFTGFRLSDLLDLVAAEGTVLKAHALNDYETDVPVEDARRFGVLIAYRVNGEPLSPADKGPLWIIYPYSAVDALQTETYYSRALWGLDRLTVE